MSCALYFASAPLFFMTLFSRMRRCCGVCSSSLIVIHIVTNDKRVLYVCSLFIRNGQPFLLAYRENYDLELHRFLLFDKRSLTNV